MRERRVLEWREGLMKKRRPLEWVFGRSGNGYLVGCGANLRR